MAEANELDLIDPRAKAMFETRPTQREPIKPDQAVSFVLDFARAAHLIEGDAPLPRPYRTAPLQSPENEADVAAWHAIADEDRLNRWAEEQW